MSATYTVAEDHGSCVVLRDGIFNSRYVGIKAANREARRLNLIAQGEAMLTLLVDSRDLYLDSTAADDIEAVEQWEQKRDALISKITGEPKL